MKKSLGIAQSYSVRTEFFRCYGIKKIMWKVHEDVEPLKRIEKITRESLAASEPITMENQYMRLEEAVTPLCHIPYHEQLRTKFHHVAKILTEVRRKSGTAGGMPNIYPVAPSPVTEGYRNKDEFNFEHGLDGDPKTLGCFIGNYSKHNTEVYCVRPTTLTVIKQRHKEIAQVFEEYVKKSALLAYHIGDGDLGYWKRLIIRSNQKGDTMAIVVVHTNSRTEEELQQERQDIVDHFRNSNCNLTSLYHQTCVHFRCTHEQSPFVLVHGERYIYEELHGCKFRISPESFFQVNTAAAEVLYEELFRVASLSQTSTVLDLCCGAGAISVLAGSHIRNCVGIEVSESAVNDAQHNAIINGVTNCEFFPGRVELLLSSALRNLEDVSDLTVIVNPGRGGLHTRAIQLIKKNPQIRKLLYVSCKPDHVITMKNFVSLLREDSDGTQPFVLNAAKPVDMFPHTEHVELILSFVRK